MVVIGFDPGSIVLGIGILKKEAGKVIRLHSEQLTLKGPSFYGKMKQLWHRLQDIYETYPITAGAIEEGFLGKNVKAMNKLSQIRGVLMASLIEKGIPVDFYSPRQIKLAISGNGNASKEQVGKMVSILLNLKDTTLGTDESDALATAFCSILGAK
jgi:crossover junction endodeoxyribonuclease RuvC